MTIGRAMVMKHALGSMQDIALFNTDRFQFFQHVVEVSVGRLVGPHILGRVNSIELNRQTLFAAFETGIVDV